MSSIDRCPTRSQGRPSWRLVFPPVGPLLLAAGPALARLPAQDFYYHADDLCSVTTISDVGGAAVERYEHADYGRPSFSNTAGAPLPSSAVGNPLLFTGRRYDQDSGWYQFRTRYLDPQSGCFTTRDTIGVWGSAGNRGNPTVYVGENPAAHLDPFGRNPCQAYWDCISLWNPVPILLYGVCSTADAVMPKDLAGCIRDCLQEHWDKKACGYNEAAVKIGRCATGLGPRISPTEIGPAVHAHCFKKCGAEKFMNTVSEAAAGLIKKIRDDLIKQLGESWLPKF